MSEKTFAREDDGNVYAKVITPENAADLFKDNGGKAALSSFVTVMKLAEALKSEQEFRVSFRYRGNTSNINIMSGLYATISFRGMSDAPLGVWARTLPLRKEWQYADLSFKAPAGTENLSVSLGLAGTGFCDFDDIVIRKASPPAERIDVSVYPMDIFDPSHFEMREKSLVPLALAPYGKKDGEALDLFLKLPKGVEVVAHANAIGTPGKMDAVQLISDDDSGILYKIDASRLDIYAFPLWARNASLLLRNSLAADGKEREIVFYAQDKSVKSTPRAYKLQITKAEQTATPKRFHTGGLFPSSNFDTDTGAELFAEYYSSTGCNAISNDRSAAATKALRGKKISFFQDYWYMINGYLIGDKPKDDDIAFLDKDGKPVGEHSRINDKSRRGICPVVVYKEMPYFKNEITNMLDGMYKSDLCDYVISNWEPAVYDFKGCYCERCRDEFIAFSKLPSEKVKAVWPRDIQISHRAEWIKFRSWQHGQVVKALAGRLRELGKNYGRTIEFSPGLVFLLAVENSGYGQQYQLDEYLDSMRYLELWGPYNYYNITVPFVRNIGLHLQSYYAAKLNNDYMAKHIPDPKKRPKLFALPHLYQSDVWLTEPETATFETLCYFMRGWAGSLLYFHPFGVDNRFWNAEARMNRQIAAYEDFTLDGAVFTNYSVAPVTPLPVNFTSAWTVKPESPEIPGQPILQSGAFRLGDRIMFGAGNFWENGECFFNLKVNGLDTEKSWHVGQPDTNTSFGAFTGAELAKGILLHAGALRWTFVVISPGGNSDSLSLAQKEIAAACQERLPGIKAKCAADQQFIDSAPERDNVIINDFSTQPEINNGDVLLKPDGMLLAVKTPLYTAKLDLNNGMALKEFTATDGTAFAGAGGIGATRVDRPGKTEVISGGFKLLKIECLNNGSILVKTERSLAGKRTAALKKLLIGKDMEFSRDAITITETLTNKTGAALSMIMSSHNFPAPLAFWGEETGSVQMDGAVFSRKGKPTAFTVGNRPISDWQKAYGSERQPSLSGGTILFSAPWSKARLQMQFALEDTDFIAFWDAYDMACATCEAISLPFELKPGSFKTLKTSWRIVE